MPDLTIPLQPVGPKTPVQAVSLLRTAMSSVVTRSAHVLVALAVGATMLVSATSPAAAAEVADQVSDLGPSGGGQSAWFWNKQTVAQPFTAGATGALTAVTVSIGNDSPGTSTGFTVGVYATASNKPTGAALAEVPFGEAAAKALGAGRTPTTVTARFDAPPIVTAGTTYAIVLSTPDTHVYHWFVGKYTTFNYSLYGNQIDSPGTWHQFSPYPMTFSTFVDATFTPGKPSAPSSLAATPENGSASIAFTPGASNGSAITNYEYRIGGAGGTWTALSPADKTSPVNIPGLVNGTATSIELRAVNALGESPASDAVTVTPRTTPSAPTSLTATAADASASIAFVAGADGGAPITNLEVELDDSGSWAALSPADASSPITVTGLTNGTPVSVKVRAVNEAGSGAPSNAVRVTPGAAAPSGGSESGGGGSGGDPAPSSAAVTVTAAPSASPSASSSVPAAPAPVAVPEPVAVGNGLVVVDGRISKVAVQVVGGRAWQVRGEGFSMEFVPEAREGELQGSFSARAGSYVDVTGDGYQPGTLVATYLPGVLAASLGEERVAADGTFSVRAKLPAMLAPGQYVLQVNGLASPTSVRSVNLGLKILEADKVESAAKRISFRRGSAALTATARVAIANFVSQHRDQATSATVVPTVPRGASPRAHSLAMRRAQAVVAAMRSGGLTVQARASKVREVSAGPGAVSVTAWIHR